MMNNIHRISGNKGEWSEIYVLLKLLGEGQVNAGDENLKEIRSLVYPIIKILRYEAEGRIDYMPVRKDGAPLTDEEDLAPEKRDVIIETADGNELLRIPASEFIEKAIGLFNALTDDMAKSGSFSVPDTENFMTKIHCHSLKARSNDKTDIKIVLHDRRTRMNSEMGFSIKSKIGGDSTLLNAAKTTNFTFKIIGADLKDEDITEINNISSSHKVLDRYKAILDAGGKLIFDHVDNVVFRNNLTMLDGDLPAILGELLLEQLESDTNMLKPLVKALSIQNPLGYDPSGVVPFYDYKIKHLLTSVALGMMPGKPWSGKFDANGGYLVVKENGDILCYHFYDRNIFEEYIYNNAYLERASTTRHQYAQIIKEDDGSLSFKLNLQIRLK